MSGSLWLSTEVRGVQSCTISGNFERVLLGTNSLNKHKKYVLEQYCVTIRSTSKPVCGAQRRGNNHMGLRIHSRRLFGTRLVTLIAAFALVAQPMYGVMVSQQAHAATGTAVPQSRLEAKPLVSNVTATTGVGAANFELKFKVHNNGLIMGQNAELNSNSQSHPQQIFSELFAYKPAEAVGYNIYIEGDASYNYTTAIYSFDVHPGDNAEGVALWAEVARGSQNAWSPSANRTVTYVINWFDADDQLQAPFSTEHVNVNVINSVIRDTSTPTVKVNLNRQSFASTGSYVNQSRNPEIQATDESGLDRIEVYKEGIATPVNAWSNLSGVKERRANISFLADGKYTIVTHDTAGNASRPFAINLDKTNPSTTLVTPTGLAGNTFTVSGETSDNIALNRVYVQLIHRETNKRYAGTTINLIPQGAGPYTWERTFDATELNLPEGTYSAHVSVTDRAGNTSSAGWSDNFTLDKVKPVIKVNLDRDRYINSGDTTGKVQNPEIEAQDARLDRIELWKEGTPTGNVWTTNNTTRRAKIGFLGEGTYVIKAFDKAGNQSDEFEVKVDNTAPVVGSIDQTATQNSITISGTTDELGSPVSITLNGEEKSVMPDEEGAWIVTFKGLTPGTVYPYVVRSADAVGNEYASPESGDDMLQAETAPLVVIPGQGAGGSPTAPTAPRDDSAVGQPTVTVMSTPGSITPLGASASAFTFPAMMAGPVTDSAVLSEQDVLGTTDTAASNTAADDDAESDDDDATDSGMAWYWWLLIAIAGIGAAWWILAALRKSSDEE